MVEFLGSECDAGHESPGFAEIGKFEGAGDTRLFGVRFPFGKGGKEVGAFCGGEQDRLGGGGHMTEGEELSWTTEHGLFVAPIKSFAT